VVKGPVPYDEETEDDHVGKYSCGDKDHDDQDFIFHGIMPAPGRCRPGSRPWSYCPKDPGLVTAEGGIVHLAVGIVALEGETRVFPVLSVVHRHALFHEQ